MGTQKVYFTEENIEKYREYVLCYVDTVPQTYYDYTPESKALIETPEYKEYSAKRSEWRDKILKEQHHISSDDYAKYEQENDPGHRFRLDMQDYPTEDFLQGYTHYLYFTDNMEEQWGDDWDDAPYEYNAEEPYDSKTNVIIVPVVIPISDEYSYDESIWDKWYKEYPSLGSVSIKFPRDYGYNSPFCVHDINLGAAAWIFLSAGAKKGVAIQGGDNFETVFSKYERMIDLLKESNE